VAKVVKKRATAVDDALVSRCGKKGGGEGVSNVWSYMKLSIALTISLSLSRSNTSCPLLQAKRKYKTAFHHLILPPITRNTQVFVDNVHERVELRN